MVSINKLSRALIAATALVAASPVFAVVITPTRNVPVQITVPATSIGTVNFIIIDSKGQGCASGGVSAGVGPIVAATIGPNNGCKSMAAIQIISGDWNRPDFTLYPTAQAFKSGMSLNATIIGGPSFNGGWIEAVLNNAQNLSESQ